MTSDKMPLMLDNSMPVDLNAVDDLFGDGVDLSLPVRVQSKQLQQRMDDIRIRGCCQYEELALLFIHGHITNTP
jgi:hypothetical protein